MFSNIMYEGEETAWPDGCLTLDASDPRFYEEPNREAYLRIHAEHPIYLVDAEHSDPFWNVCTHDLIREVGQDTDLYTSEDGVHLVNTAFATSGQEDLANALRPAIIRSTEEHRQVRGPINPFFRHDRIGEMEDGIRATVRSLLDEIEQGVEVDFMEAFGSRVPILVIAQLMGVSAERERDFGEWGDAVLTSFEPGNEPNLAALGELAQYFLGEIQACKADVTAGADQRHALDRSPGAGGADVVLHPARRRDRDDREPDRRRQRACCFAIPIRWPGSPMTPLSSQRRWRRCFG